MKLLPEVEIKSSHVSLKWERMSFDYFKIDFIWPVFCFSKNEYELGEETVRNEISFPTKIVNVWADAYCGIEMLILGFGFRFVKQKGY